MLDSVFWVTLAGDSREVIKAYLVSKFGILAVFVYGKDVGSKYYIDGFPRLGLLGPLAYFAGFDDPVRIVCAVRFWGICVEL